MTFQILQGNSLDVLKTLPNESAQTCITSPPYYGLRSYLNDDDSSKSLEIGLETSPREYIEKIVKVFREVRRVLRADGTCFINLGDSYANDGKWGGRSGGKHVQDLHGKTSIGRKKQFTGLKPKDLMLMPHRCAIALQDDGWFVRNDLVWDKSNGMCEAVKDRFTKTHEYIFFLTKNKNYFFDQEAVREPYAEKTKTTWGSSFGKDRNYGDGTGLVAAENWANSVETHQPNPSGKANKRSVWRVATANFPEAHFATFPAKLIEPCILAGSKEGDIVLDPFSGAGTTGVVAKKYGRDFIGIELNQSYIEMSERRLSNVQGEMF